MNAGYPFFSVWGGPVYVLYIHVTQLCQSLQTSWMNALCEVVLWNMYVCMYCFICIYKDFANVCKRLGWTLAVRFAVCEVDRDGRSQRIATSGQKDRNKWSKGSQQPTSMIWRAFSPRCCDLHAFMYVYMLQRSASKKYVYTQNLPQWFGVPSHHAVVICMLEPGCMYVSMYMCVYMYTCCCDLHARTCMYVCIYVCVYVCIHVYMLLWSAR